jgi:phosphoglycolate phosphatase-like HAD superfamily hydrolase
VSEASVPGRPESGGDRSSRTLAVFDVDGVLADVGHRLHHLQGERKDWRAFFAAAHQDPPLGAGIDLARELAEGFRLAYLTGRPERLRTVTQGWLHRHGLPVGPLWMRAPGDFRPARVMKLEALRQLAGPPGVEVVVDDDVEVVTALRAAGYAVLQATWAETARSGPGSSAARRVLREAQEADGRT